jgi:hypothetical protein
VPSADGGTSLADSRAALTRLIVLSILVEPKRKATKIMRPARRDSRLGPGSLVINDYLDASSSKAVLQRNYLFAKTTNPQVENAVHASGSQACVDGIDQGAGAGVLPARAIWFIT